MMRYCICRLFHFPCPSWSSCQQCGASLRRHSPKLLLVWRRRLFIVTNIPLCHNIVSVHCSLFSITWTFIVLYTYIFHSFCLIYTNKNLLLFLFVVCCCCEFRAPWYIQYRLHLGWVGTNGLLVFFPFKPSPVADSFPKCYLVIRLIQSNLRLFTIIHFIYNYKLVDKYFLGGIKNYI